ncbi:MAG: helix-turn-helix domain-containing protein [Alphaproteobacteria bacterium]
MDHSGPPNLTIGILAKRTGCKVETIRYYEKIGVLPAPGRSSGGQRRYEPGHLKRLNFVRRARDLGFTLADVRSLLGFVDDQDRSRTEIQAIGARHLENVRARLSDLRAMERVLDDMVVRCQCGGVPDCPIIDALFDDDSMEDHSQ